MASLNYEKAKSKTQLKRWIRHVFKKLREEGEHSNENLNTAYTYLNQVLTEDMTYEEVCQKIDETLDMLDNVAPLLADDGHILWKPNRRKDRTVGIGIEAPIPVELLGRPEGVPDSQLPKDYRDKPNAAVTKWAENLLKELKDIHGAGCLLYATIDWDEQHFYMAEVSKDTPGDLTIKPDKNGKDHYFQWRLSLPHVHSFWIPMKDLDTDRPKLCGKDFCSRKNLIRAQAAAQKMTAKEFGVSYQTGKFDPEISRKSMSRLKADSKAVEDEYAYIEAEKARLEKMRQDMLARSQEIERQAQEQRLLIEKGRKARDEELEDFTPYESGSAADFASMMNSLVGDDAMEEAVRRALNETEDEEEDV